jgi:hypothetical protein
MTTTVAEATNGTNWELIFIGLTALATLVLAGATFYLALSTRKTASSTETLASETRSLVGLTESEVEAVREDVSVSRATHEGNVRPVLVNVPFGRLRHEQGDRARVPGTGEVVPVQDPGSVIVAEVSGRLFVSVPLRNAGAGIAFLWNAQFNLAGSPVKWGGHVSTAALPPGEAMRISLSLPTEWPEETSRPEGAPTPVLPTLDAVLDRRLFSVSVHYADLARNKWSTRLNLSLAEPAHVWEVVNVILGDEGRTDEVGSGVAWDFLSHSTGRPT